MPPFKKKTQQEQAVNEINPASVSSDMSDDFSADLIRQLNKESGEQIAFNLGTDDAPTNIKRWISTGSKQLDYVISNRRNGGLPEGRIIEIQGPPSCGKSHIAFEIAKSTQKMGGLVVYIDTENATSLDNLKQLGIDVAHRFVFVQTGCTEEVFKVAEAAIMKSRASTKDVPVTIIWDSVAASAPQAELTGEYTDNTIGLQARVLGKGLRKIANIIANQKVLFVLLNQQRQKIGVMYGDPTTTPGGMAIPYAASTRIRISTGAPVKVGKDQVIGIEVDAKTIKNKVAKPFRVATFQIHFGRGVIEHEQVFDFLRTYCEVQPGKCIKHNGMQIAVQGTGAWKTFTVVDDKTGEVIVEEKFYKPDFGTRVLYNPVHKEQVDALMDAAYIMNAANMDHPTFAGVDTSSAVEQEALKAERGVE